MAVSQVLNSEYGVAEVAAHESGKDRHSIRGSDHGKHTR